LKKTICVILVLWLWTLLSSCGEDKFSIFSSPPKQPDATAGETEKALAEKKSPTYTQAQDGTLMDCGNFSILIPSGLEVQPQEEVKDNQPFLYVFEQEGGNMNILRGDNVRKGTDRMTEQAREEYIQMLKESGFEPMDMAFETIEIEGEPVDVVSFVAETRENEATLHFKQYFLFFNDCGYTITMTMADGETENVLFEKAISSLKLNWK